MYWRNAPVMHSRNTYWTRYWSAITETYPTISVSIGYIDIPNKKILER